MQKGFALVQKRVRLRFEEGISHVDQPSEQKVVRDLAVVVSNYGVGERMRYVPK